WGSRVQIPYATHLHPGFLARIRAWESGTLPSPPPREGTTNRAAGGPGHSASGCHLPVIAIGLGEQSLDVSPARGLAKLRQFDHDPSLGVEHGIVHLV